VPMLTEATLRRTLQPSRYRPTATSTRRLKVLAFMSYTQCAAVRSVSGPICKQGGSAVAGQRQCKKQCGVPWFAAAAGGGGGA